MASRAAILAMGKPVALLARAEERETRGFISMTTRRPVFGSTANWMFEPPVSTPTSRMMARAALRMTWYSRSVRVWAGATVTESPGVDAHRVEVLDGADHHEVVGPVPHHLELVLLPPEHGLLDEDLVDGREVDPARGELLELLEVVGDAAAGAAQGEGGPDDRGKARRSRGPSRASSRFVAKPLRGTSSPMRAMASLKSWRSSPISTARRLAPMSRTPSRSRTPRRESSTARLSAVCPPTVGRSASGRSRSRMAVDRLRGERLDVRAVGVLRVGHDRGRVRVHERDPQALLLEDLDGLGARVVELAGLPDHDRPRADHEHRLDRRVPRHRPTAPRGGRASSRRTPRRGSGCRGGRGWPPGGTGRRAPAGRACGSPRPSRRSGSRG